MARPALDRLLSVGAATGRQSGVAAALVHRNARRDPGGRNRGPDRPTRTTATLRSVAGRCRTRRDLHGRAGPAARERRRDSRPSAQWISSDADDIDGAPCTAIDEAEAWDHAFDGPPAVGDDRAYIIFTSGSTGRPKGIVHTHASAIAYAERAATIHRLGPTSRLAGTAPLHFDMSTLELYAVPLAGATAVTIREQDLLFPASLAGRIEERAVTHLYAVPSQLKQLLQRGDLAATDVGSVTQVGFGADRHPMAEGRNAGRQGPPLPLPWQGGQSPQGPGVRIELEEIEHVLGDAPGVGHAAVAVVEGANSHEVVRAFITPSDPTGFAITALIAHCRSRLPEAAVPAEITLLDSMPTTQSGKVDRRALAVREHYDR